MGLRFERIRCMGLDSDSCSIEAGSDGQKLYKTRNREKSSEVGWVIPCPSDCFDDLADCVDFCRAQRLEVKRVICLPGFTQRLPLDDWEGIKQLLGPDVEIETMQEPVVTPVHSALIFPTIPAEASQAPLAGTAAQ